MLQRSSSRPEPDLVPAYARRALVLMCSLLPRSARSRQVREWLDHLEAAIETEQQIHHELLSLARSAIPITWSSHVPPWMRTIVPSLALATAAILLFWPTTPGSKRPPLALDTSGATAPVVRLSTVAYGNPIGGCVGSACRMLRVDIANFDGGSHTIVCRASNGDEGGWHSYATSGLWGSSEGCYYGIPRRSVWVTVDGVESNHVPW